MDEETNESQAKANLHSFEEGWFGAVFEFHKKIMALLRQSSLEDEQLGLVAERIKRMLDAVTVEINRKNAVNPQGQLELAFEEAKRLVDETEAASQESGATSQRRARDR